MKKIAVASLLLTMFFLLPTITSANDYPASIELSEDTSLHSGATVQYRILLDLKKGQSYQVVGEFTNSLGEKWYNVSTAGLKGWALASKFKSNDLIGQQARVTEDNVNVRSGATTAYKVLDKVSKDKVVSVIDVFKNAANETWYRVTYDNVTGWVISTFLEKIESSPPPAQPAAPVEINKKFTVAKDSVIVRSGATSSYKELTRLSKGTHVNAILEFTNASGEKWYRVDLQTLQGWVLSTDLTEYKPPAQTQYPQNKTVSLSQAAIRTGASDAYKLIQYASAGSNLLLVGEHTNGNGQLWYNVDLGSSRGWINSQAFVGSLPVESYKFAKGATVYTSSDNATVRTGATDAYAVVSQLKFNTALKITDRFNNSLGDNWYRIEASGVSGWIKETFLIAEKASGEVMVINVDNANLRSGPSLSHSILQKANEGEKLNVIKTNGNQADLWYMSTRNGQEVWFHHSVANKESSSGIGEERTVQTKNAVIRSGASTQYRIVNYPAFGTKVTITGSHSTNGSQWYQVRTATGVTGWIQEVEIRKSYEYRYTIGQAVVYKGASTTYAVAARPPVSDRLQVLGTLGSWLNVETSAGVRGWIPTSSTSTQSVKILAAPAYGNGIINWVKPSNFNVTYSTSGTNQLRITGDFTDAQLPTQSIPGIDSIQNSRNANGTNTVVVTFKPGYTFTLRNYSDRVTLKIMQFGLSGKRIIIDAGHGGADSGAIGATGLYEKTVVLDTAKRLQTLLQNEGATVLMTRSTDVFLELSERTAISNNSDYDVFVSIHADSFSSTSRGSTTFYNASVNFNGPRSLSLARSVHKHMVYNIGTYDRGVREEVFYVNRMNQLPSVLLELAFLSNPTEEALLRDPAFRQKAAVGIKNGLSEYFSQF
ncbi:SH3 domain-containing protein [Jeotgalibacillus sp. R-1-5s-1]|uniref:SH3 domain-containing protein n=1 Tax=Jeotgalibacillus sp. R-1-5s-1 TaxID=2555897 RepID=UPI00106D0D58|nr:SH3 domain-containing protein [Jeotgalibacillus sp. R-1-5s-1]TFD95765.1 N-acetylmuramoyl-L-alanine amidase [Jeotgalibacillus sp. R-1-5s-1]